MGKWGPFSVEGQNVIVTGAARGIGLATSRRFVEGGANVLLADIDEPAVAAATASMTGGPGRAHFVCADVGADGVGSTIVDRCLEAFGSVDVLVNNAGIFPQVPALEMTRSFFDRVQQVNLRGLVFLSQAAGRRMAQQRQGTIINVGSVDSVHPSMVGLAAYDTSKGGVLMFTKSFALEMAAFGVRVNMIAPGAIATEGVLEPAPGTNLRTEDLKAAAQKIVEAKVPMRRMGEPDEIAKVALFLASTASSYMTGSLVVADGGLLLG